MSYGRLSRSLSFRAADVRCMLLYTEANKKKNDIHIFLYLNLSASHLLLKFELFYIRNDYEISIFIILPRGKHFKCVVAGGKRFKRFYANFIFCSDVFNKYNIYNLLQILCEQ